MGATLDMFIKNGSLIVAVIHCFIIIFINMFVIFGESFLGLKKFLLKNPDGISKVFGAHKLQSSHLDFRQNCACNCNG